MKSCPGCTFLVDDDAAECQFCGADTSGRGPAPVQAADMDGAELNVPREKVSTRLTAGVIVVSALSLVGVGAWAFHRTPPPATPARTSTSGPAAAAVRYRSVSVVDGAVTYRLDVAVGADDPDLSSGVISKYATARQLDIVHLPTGGNTDLTATLATFSAGWPTSDVASITTQAGAGVSFVLTTGTDLTHGTLIDSGATGLFLVAVKAPLGSAVTATDRAALQRAVSSLRPSVSP